jgi:hypothetical protein
VFHRRLSLFLKALLVVEAAFALWEQQWLTAVITLGIIGITLFPLITARGFGVFIPPEFELVAVAFIFASLFLGEIYGYYTRFWWWDIALHTISGLLLGVIGFLLVHVLNESEDIGLHMKPGFLCPGEPAIVQAQHIISN